jgi:hypothetical protein
MGRPIAQEVPMPNEKFTDKAAHLVDEHTEPEHGRKYATSDAPPSEDELKVEQQQEMADAWTGPGVGAMTGSMGKGLVFGALVGGLIGALIFAPFGFIPIGDVAVGWRILLFAVIGALAGGTAGAMYFGGRMPELEGETVNADGSPGVGTAARDPGTDDRGRPSAEPASGHERAEPVDDDVR